MLQLSLCVWCCALIVTITTLTMIIKIIIYLTSKRCEITSLNKLIKLTKKTQSIKCVQHQLETLRKFDMGIQCNANFLIQSWITLASMRILIQKDKFPLLICPVNDGIEETIISRNISIKDLEVSEVTSIMCHVENIIHDIRGVVIWKLTDFGQETVNALLMCCFFI